MIAKINHFSYLSKPLRFSGWAGNALPPDGGDFFAREATPDGGPIPKIARLVLVPKLLDVRVQIGFTRLEPVMPDLEGEFDLAVQSAPLSLTQDWLPASERGEGVFLQLDEKAVWD